MKTYTCHDPAEASRLASGEQTMIVVPMEPQPDWMTVCGDMHVERDYDTVWSVHNWHAEGPRLGSQREAPYAPGDAVGIVCRSGMIEVETATSLRILTVEAKMVTEITEEQARLFFWRPCPKMDSFSGWHYESICQDRECAARWLGPLIEEWDYRHPDLPWAGKPWTWMFGTELVKGDQ